jgi:hypothetical protein
VVGIHTQQVSYDWARWDSRYRLSPVAGLVNSDTTTVSAEQRRSEETDGGGQSSIEMGRTQRATRG